MEPICFLNDHICFLKKLEFGPITFKIDQSNVIKTLNTYIEINLTVGNMGVEFI